MADQKPGEMYEVCPLILFVPKEAPVKDEKAYECPCYKTLTRAGVLSTTGHSTNFVCTVWLMHDKESEDYWVQQGAALMCALRD